MSPFQYALALVLAACFVFFLGTLAGVHIAVKFAEWYERHGKSDDRKYAPPPFD